MVALQTALEDLGISNTSYGGEYGPAQGVVDPHHPFFGAVGDVEFGIQGEFNGNVLTVESNFTPSQYYVGKSLWSSIFGGGASRTITAISGRDVTFDGSAIGATTNSWMMGTDDTEALRKALRYAAYSPTSTFDVSGNLVTGAFVGTPTQFGLPSSAAIFGRVVKLRAGHRYGVFNSSTSWDAYNTDPATGSKAALTVPRRCGLVGEGHMQSMLVALGAHKGHIVMSDGAAHPNFNANAYCDFITLSDFGVYGGNGFVNADSTRDGEGVYVRTSFDGYQFVDPHIRVNNVAVFNSRRDAFFFGGRGEMLLSELRGHQARRYGIQMFGLADSQLLHSKFGGSGRTGIRIYSSGACRIVGTKAFYNGKSGGSNTLDCANMSIDADQKLNGKILVSGCDLQEARGSNLVIATAGYNHFSGLRCQDPGQQNGLEGGTLPTVRAGVHLLNAASSENSFESVIVEPSVRGFQTDNMKGTHALFIEDGAAANVGNITTQADSAWETAKIGGAGTTNGANTGLRVDGVALT